MSEERSKTGNRQSYKFVEELARALPREPLRRRGTCNPETVTTKHRSIVRVGAAAAFAMWAVALSGCASLQFVENSSATPVVPISAVLNSLKCGLSNSLVSDTANRSGLRNAKALVKLKVNVVEAKSANGTISAGIPISTGTGSVKFGLTRDSTLTNNSTLDFQLKISGENQLACGAVNGVYQDAGFSLWLTDLVAGINQAIGGPPYASIKEYSYESNFIIKQGGSGGAEFSIVPVKVGASVSSTRSDIQYISIKISAVHYDPKQKKIVPDGPDFAPWPTDAQVENK